MILHVFQVGEQFLNSVSFRECFLCCVWPEASEGELSPDLRACRSPGRSLQLISLPRRRAFGPAGSQHLCEKHSHTVCRLHGDTVFIFLLAATWPRAMSVDTFRYIANELQATSAFVHIWKQKKQTLLVSFTTWSLLPDCLSGSSKSCLRSWGTQGSIAKKGPNAHSIRQIALCVSYRSVFFWINFLQEQKLKATIPAQNG